jgi:hypothetical protein
MADILMQGTERFAHDHGHHLTARIIEDFY